MDSMTTRQDLPMEPANLAALARRAGGYAAAAGLAAWSHPHADRLRSADALVLMMAGHHADMALHSSSGYAGATLLELAALMPSLAPSAIRVSLDTLQRFGFMASRTEGEGDTARVLYRLAPKITEPFDTAPAE